VCAGGDAMWPAAVVRACGGRRMLTVMMQRRGRGCVFDEKS